MTGSATTTLRGFVKMVVDVPNKPETADIAVEGADQERNIITIENTLIDKSDREVHLNPGAKVEVTIDAEAAAVRAAEEWLGMPGNKE